MTDVPDVPHSPAGNASPRHRSTGPVLSAVVVASLVVAGTMTVAAGDSPKGVGTAGDADPAAAHRGDAARDGFGVSRGSPRPALRAGTGATPDRRGAEVRRPGTSRAKAPSGPRDVARGLLAEHGWSSAEFGCLDDLWVGESNWDPSAENPTSGAYGIPQALPPEKMSTAGRDWRTNATTQIEWGLGYIASRYGSPCAANSFKLSNGWY